MDYSKELNTKIFGYLDAICDAYSETVQVTNGLTFDHDETIRTVEFYTSNKFLSGNIDGLGREKPFYNVCNYRVTTAKTATDLDVKDIRYEPDSLKDSVPTMLINKELFKYLKESNFSLTLNEMGITRPKYGGVLVKKYEDEGDLKIEVVEWKNVKVDPCDILGGAIIETFYLQPSEIYYKSDVWDIDDFVEAHAKLHKNKPAKLEVKEVSGEFPETFWPENDGKDKKDESRYERMCFYIGLCGKKKYLLHYEYEKESRYKYLPWEKVSGRGLGRGVVEDGFESQVWVNDSIIAMKNAMELAGKVILSTTSRKVSGNAITGVQSGHIFELEENRTINSLNLAPSALPQFERIIELWNQQYDRVASTFNANTGEQPPSGTPYSQTALLSQVANSPFEYRREEWGIFLNEILNDWIFPHLKKKILKKHNLVADYEDDELDVIDDAIAAFEGNKMMRESIMAGKPVMPEDQAVMMGDIRDQLKKRGKKREVEIPEGFLDIEGKVTANITGELKNKAAVLQSLDGIFKTVVSTFNPQTGQYAALQDPVLAKIFGQIVEMSGVPFSAGQLRLSGSTTGAPADLSAITPMTPNAGASAAV